jgi:diguanylate cyclase (GGDEF)-like protein/PAS domain S-box-containing protein
MAVSDGDHGPHVIWANRAMVDLLGIDAGALVGVPLSDLIDLGDAPETAWSWVALGLIRGPNAGGPAVVRRLDGTDQPVQVQAQRLPAATGRSTEPDTWVITLLPQGALDDAEAKLRESEHRFTALAECAPVGIVVSEAGVRLGYVNVTFQQLTSRADYELLGTGWLTGVHPEDVTTLLGAAERVLGGEPSEVSYRITGAAGHRWLQLRLAPTITPSRAAGFIGVVEDVTERRAWAEKLVYQAQHDPLTGLANRRSVVESLTEMLGSKRGRDRRIALLFLDLDGFKAINDTFGHEAGDRVLIEVARRMQRTVRDGDLVGRIAGDEFVVILRNVYALEEAESAARRYLEALSRPHVVAGRSQRVLASMGIAMPGPDETPESMLRLADGLMYEAKAAGTGLYRTVTMTAAAPADAPPQSRRADPEERP